MSPIVTLPIVMALSWVPAQHTRAPSPEPTQQKAEKAKVATVTCPLTGEEIPSCCCPVKK